MAFLELQGSTEMVTKSELMERVRLLGSPISDRNLSYYGSIGLIPPAVRIGARGGAYPGDRDRLRRLGRSLSDVGAVD
jgi:hypothetical protein